MKACQEGHDETVKIMINSGANINLFDNQLFK